MKKNLLFFVMLLCAVQYAAAADYYTASASATLTGNTTASANWTTNPNGVTGLTTFTITATDNLFILNGGSATITNTGTVTVAALTTSQKEDCKTQTFFRLVKQVRQMCGRLETLPHICLNNKLGNH